MQFIILAALAATAAAAPQYYDSNVNMTSIYTCGSQPYRPEAYTCYDNTVLCPVINDRRQEACAGGCYDPMFYGCTDGVLQQVANGTFANGTVANTTAYSGTQYGGVNVTLANSTYSSGSIRRAYIG